MKDDTKARCLILSDFNGANLAGYINNSSFDMGTDLQAECAPFGQVQSILLDPHAPCRESPCDLLLVWTTPQGLFDCFRKSLHYETVSTEDLLNEVEAFADSILQATDWAKFIILPAWTLPNYYRGLGMLEWNSGEGVVEKLTRMNLRLSEKISSNSQVFMLDAGRWMNYAGRSAFNPKLWFMGKIPFSFEVFKLAARDIQATYAGLNGQARKLIVLDLDNTLWGGIVGDAGWENLKLGGHDAIGEAFLEFQRQLKAFANRGIILGIVSKNEESVALNAICKHPEMILKKNDFSGWRINWSDKAQNILELAQEINIGLQSVVFIDDNPAERARVKEALPEILVPDWPEDPLLYVKALHELTCFDVPSIGYEDQQRSRMYAAERQRVDLQKNVDSLDQWLSSLELEVLVEQISENNFKRTVQLLNKTNQMNLSTRRLSEAELNQWLRIPGHDLWTFRVSDRFGDAGLTGILSFSQEGKTLRIVDFILSCRVFGREIEMLMLAEAIAEAQARGCNEIYAEFLPTSKNKPTLDFLQRSGMKEDSTDKVFRWNVNDSFSIPEHIKLRKHI